MTKQEIEQAAKELYEIHKEVELTYGTYISDAIDVEKSEAFIAGANFVNERQPYSQKDAKRSFMAGAKWWKGVMLKNNDLTMDDAFKLWEESKNE